VSLSAASEEEAKAVEARDAEDAEDATVEATVDARACFAFLLLLRRVLTTLNGELCSLATQRQSPCSLLSTGSKITMATRC